jgi:hypothetical protein
MIGGRAQSQSGGTSRPRGALPLDPALVRLVEALADANAERDHQAALAACDGDRARRK